MALEDHEHATLDVGVDLSAMVVNTDGAAHVELLEVGAVEGFDPTDATFHPTVFLTIGGRINNTDDKVRHNYLLTPTDAGALIGELTCAVQMLGEESGEEMRTACHAVIRSTIEAFNDPNQN
jgi:hypothetical protein